MEIKIHEKVLKSLHYGCILYNEVNYNKFLVVRSYEVETYPVALIDLESNEIVNCYKSLEYVEKEYSNYVIYQPNEIKLEVGIK